MRGSYFSGCDLKRILNKMRPTNKSKLHGENHCRLAKKSAKLGTIFKFLTKQGSNEMQVNRNLLSIVYAESSFLQTCYFQVLFNRNVEVFHQMLTLSCDIILHFLIGWFLQWNNNTFFIYLKEILKLIFKPARDSENETITDRKLNQSLWLQL